MKAELFPKKNGDAAVSSRVRKVMLVDDHPVMREGLAQLINHEPDLRICGQYEDAACAFEAVPAVRPDLAIVDLTLKRGSGLELVKNIRANYPNLVILVLSMHDESLYAERVLRAGAAGYITKQEASDKVLGAIRRVLGGDVYLSERMSGRLMHELIGGKAGRGGSLMERLSDRELEIFGLIGQGRGTRQIAEQLHLSIKTVESHRAHIKEKLNLKNANELVHQAIRARGEEGSPN
jgi:DNA-binding NarL/FixJ family response regulator